MPLFTPDSGMSETFVATMEILDEGAAVLITTAFFDGGD